MIASLSRIEVVSAFVRRNGKILLLQRSEKVASYRGKWSAVSGYMEQGTPLEQALREIREETGFEENDVRLAASATPLEIPARDGGVLWVVHPFLFELDSVAEVALDWESVDSVWIKPEHISEFDTVPMLAETLDVCLTEERRGSN